MNLQTRISLALLRDEKVAVQERDRVLITATPHPWAAPVLAAGTGMQQRECLGLADTRLDLDNHTLRVEQQLILLPRREPFLGPPKTPASHRTIPLPAAVVTALREHLAGDPVQHRDRLVFTDDDREASRTRFSREIWRLANAAAGCRGTGFHDLRNRPSDHPPWMLKK